ncbi:MAG: hypothetical protein KJ579_00330 [Verrucomicrobia bacterium]|nr:hypothetical protein [Verrucomicrobiota bacterium]
MMKPRGLRSAASIAAAVFAVALLAGCGEGDSDGAPPRRGGLRSTSDGDSNSVSTASSALRLVGKWSGMFYNAQSGGNGAISATITQEGDVVTIDTSLPGLGGYFTGTVDAAGNMWLTDSWDGEMWTTHMGPATGNYMIIQDYVDDPDGSGEQFLNTIELSR